MNNNTYGYKLASKGKRLIASLIEGIIFMILTMIIYSILGLSFSDYLYKDFEFTDIAYSGIFALIVGAVFYPLFIGNLGHRIFKLKVISLENGEDFKKPQDGAIRELLKNVLGYLIIPIIWILWDDMNQNLYDKLTKTIVVERND